MAVSLLSSLFISYLYVHFYSNRATGSQVHRAFPLLGHLDHGHLRHDPVLAAALARPAGRAVDRPLPHADQGARGDRLHHARHRRVDRGGDIQARIRRHHLRRRARGAVRPGADAPLRQGAEATARSSSRCRRTAKPPIPPRSPRCSASGCRKPSSRACRRPIAKPSCRTTSRASPTPRSPGLQAELNAAAGPSTYNVFFNRPGAL